MGSIPRKDNSIGQWLLAQGISAKAKILINWGKERDNVENKWAYIFEEGDTSSETEKKWWFKHKH